MAVCVRDGKFVFPLTKFSGDDDDFDLWYRDITYAIEYSYHPWVVQSPLEYDSENPILAGVNEDEWASTQKEWYFILSSLLPTNTTCRLARMMATTERFSDLLDQLRQAYRPASPAIATAAFGRLVKLRLTRVSDIPAFLIAFNRELQCVRAVSQISDLLVRLSLFSALSPDFLEKHSHELNRECKGKVIFELSPLELQRLLNTLYSSQRLRDRLRKLSAPYSKERSLPASSHPTTQLTACFDASTCNDCEDAHRAQNGTNRSRKRRRPSKQFIKRSRPHSSGHNDHSHHSGLRSSTGGQSSLNSNGGSGSPDYSHTTCYRCQQKGHYSYDCMAPFPVSNA